jgi:hypothetical protein
LHYAEYNLINATGKVTMFSLFFDTSKRFSFIQRVKVFSIISIFCLSSIQGILAQDRLVDSCSSEAKNALRLVVVARDSIESTSLYKGVLGSCVNSKWKTPVKVTRHIYDNDDEGFELISKIVCDGSADVIIGPTDSSLYADLVAFLKFEKFKVPIISPAVTVDLGNKTDGWIFRTNVNAIDRVRIMFEYLLSKNIENVALLYTDSTFGEISEAAFRKNLRSVSDVQLNSFRFAGLSEAWPLIQQINTLRPEAIGIMGSRQEIEQLSTKFRGPHNEWNAFDPYVFTIVDTRGLKLDGIHFLSVGRYENLAPELVAASGELLDLSFDTTELILTIADDMLSRDNLPNNRLSNPSSKPSTYPDWPTEFRKRLVGAMTGSVTKPPSRTGMEFANLQNIAKPKVMTTVGDNINIKDLSASGWQQAAKNWLDIRERRFGVAPIVNIVLITLIVLMLTVFDLKKSHRVSNRDLLRIPFILLVLLNVSIANSLFIYTAEIGVLEWDSVMGALLLAFGYSGLLKTTVFETAAGQSIGLKRYHENLVTWIYDKIRKQQFEKMGPVINHIAYANSRPYLMSTLLESYSFAGDDVRIQTLKDNLQVKLDKQQTMLGTRKVLAKEVFNEVSWAKLQERRIVPRDSQPIDIYDPEPIVDVSVQYCFRNDPDCLSELEKLVNQKLNNAEYTELKMEFTADLASSITPRAKISSCIRWSILLLGYDLKLMILNGLLPSDFKLEGKTSLILGRFKKQVKKIERRATIRFNNQATQVQLSFDDKLVHGNIVDISEGGVRLLIDKSELPLPKKLQLTTITDDAAVKLESVQAKLVNSSQHDDGKALIGFCWEKLTRQSRGNINGYLRSVLEA